MRGGWAGPEGAGSRVLYSRACVGLTAAGKNAEF